MKEPCLITRDDLTLITSMEDDRLHTPVVTVDDIDEARAYVPAMLAMIRHHNAPGLAANQVGLDLPIIVTSLPDDMPYILINPTLTGIGGRVEVEERCLCNGEHTAQRKRHEHASVHAFNILGEQILINTWEGYYAGGREQLGKKLAAVLQHKDEHLMGIDVLTGEVRI